MKPVHSWSPVRAAQAVPAFLVRPLLFLAVVLFGTVALAYTVLFAPRVPPEKLYTGPITAQQQDGLAQTAQARTEQLCRLRQLCSDYAKARQTCVAAQNFTLCMDFKLGHQAVSAGTMCRTDGGTSQHYDDMPDVLQCPASPPDGTPEPAVMQGAPPLYPRH